MVTGKVSLGFTAGTERFAPAGLVPCSRNAAEGSRYCAQHAAKMAKIRAHNAARRLAAEQ